jgi:hypothetical protein
VGYMWQNRGAQLGGGSVRMGIAVPPSWGKVEACGQNYGGVGSLGNKKEEGTRFVCGN